MQFTVHSDFEAQENSLSLFPLFPHLYAVKVFTKHPLSVLGLHLGYHSTFSFLGALGL